MLDGILSTLLCKTLQHELPQPRELWMQSEARFRDKDNMHCTNELPCLKTLAIHTNFTFPIPSMSDSLEVGQRRRRMGL